MTAGRLAAAVGLLCLLARAAGAAEPAAAAPTAAVKSEARERFALGLKLFEKGENPAALAEFKRAYELIPNPLVLYNIGLVYAAMERPVDAADALDKFLGGGGASVAAEPGKRARQVRDEQTKRIAQLLVVTSKPATIEIDGVEAGRTPLASPLRLASGAHVVAAMAPGHLPARHEVTLAGQVTQTLNITLQPTESTVAQLTLVVAVPGVEVLVNGKAAGVTPLPASIGVPPGNATVELRRPGYRSVSQSIRLDESARGALTMTIEEDAAAPASLRGRMKLAASEPGAEMIIDGVRRPQSPDGVPIVAGPHVVKVERGGFLPFERQVDIAAGQELTLAAVLTPTPETRLHYEESVRTRRTLGWSIVGAGALVTVGSAVFAVVASGNVSDAQTALDGQLAVERDPTKLCYINNPDYAALNCDETKAAFQDDLDSAKLKRNLALVGIGVGLASAGVGTYLLMTGNADKYATRVSFWSDGHGGGLTAVGRF